MSVALVGAGPGAADLLTLRAVRLLQTADVVVFDRLVSDDILDFIRPGAERIYVGKSRANHCLPQHAINALLVRLAREGKRVVRLKGGDPFVFGRGGEEAEALAAAGIACDIVPGVTAALGCAAQFGIPLTHRDHSRVLTFATGHVKDGAVDLDFAALARTGGTIALYMATATLAEVTAALQRHGLPGTTPAAVVFRGSAPDAALVQGVLADLAARIAASGETGPGMVIIGEVVTARAEILRKALNFA